jgi:hypothetical protein
VANSVVSPLSPLAVQRAFPATRFWRDLFAWDSVSFGVVCILDMISTLIWVRQGVATESNPLLAYCLAHGVVLFVLAKFASFLPALAIAARFRPAYSQFVPLVLRSALAAYVVIYVSSVAYQFLGNHSF